MKNYMFVLFSTFIVSCSYSQTKILIAPTLAHQKDSILINLVIPSLTTYLDKVEGDNNLNEYISPKYKAQNYVLTDQLKGMQISYRFKNDHFYKPTLVNAIPQKDKSYHLQLAYQGVNDSTSIVIGLFNLIAEKSADNRYVFSTPLLTNTINWKTKTVGITTYHYKDELDAGKALEYNTRVEMFDKKLNNQNQSIHYYLCQDAHEVFSIVGIQFKSQYNGQNTFSIGSSTANETVMVSSTNGKSFDIFDPHDLWHDRLAQHIPRNKVNKSIDEACAYLYGGSWGISWTEIFASFKSKVANDKQKDWLTSYGKHENFGVSQELHLYPEYVINALLVQKIEKEKGFPAVLEFLKTGKNDSEDKTNSNYFKALYKLTGITKENYNAAVWTLIENEIK